jgi:hypothetical protein
MIRVQYSIDYERTETYVSLQALESFLMVLIKSGAIILEIE